MARALFRTLVAAVAVVALLRALAPLLLSVAVRTSAAAANTFVDFKLADNLELFLQQIAAADAARATSRRLLVRESANGSGSGKDAPGSWQNAPTAALQQSNGSQPEAPELRSGLVWDAFVQAVLPGSANPSYRIIGGKAAPPSRYKWFCSLRSATTEAHFCGCSLIAPNAVLTAAHCLDQQSNALRYPIIEIGRVLRTAPNSTAKALVDNSFDHARCTASLVHPGWAPSLARNDLALCFFEGTSRFKPVELAKGSDPLPQSNQLVVMGFGATQEGGPTSEHLLMTRVAVEAVDSCNATYGNMLGPPGQQICAGLPEGGADACQGDSGGPLFAQGASAAADKQFGVVSFGTGCGRKAYPGVYTDVRAYLPWVQRQVQRMATRANTAAGGTVGPAGAGAAAGAAAAAPATSKDAAVAPDTPAGAVAPPTMQQAGLADAGAAAPLAGAAHGDAPIDAPGEPLVDTVGATDGCACTANGTSGGADVGGRSGCAAHGLEGSKAGQYCYVENPDTCTASMPSVAFLTAAWVECVPQAAMPPAPAAEAARAAAAQSAVPPPEAPAKVKARSNASAAAAQTPGVTRTTLGQEVRHAWQTRVGR